MLISPASGQGFGVVAEKRFSIGAGGKEGTPVPESQCLSQRLRVETSTLHREIERHIDLPSCIAGSGDYVIVLTAFYRLYRPLEAQWTGFDEWAGAGINLEERLHAPRLARDLSALGVSPDLLLDAPAKALPDLATFNHCLGALYVLEGSTLGGQFILRDLQTRFGCQFAEAAEFFGGYGENTVPQWKSFKEALDAYGATHPECATAMLDGAVSTFRAIGRWMDGQRP